MLTNYELKQKARAALQDHGWTAVLILAVSTVFYLLAQASDIMAGADSTQKLLQLVTNLARGKSLRQAAVLYLAESNDSPAISVLLGFAHVIVGPVLALGYKNYVLRLHRGENAVGLEHVFAYKEYFWPALGLDLLLSLRVLAWCLPGGAVLLLGMLLDANQSAVGTLLIILGVIAVAALYTRACYEYGMAMYIKTDRPYAPAGECGRESKSMMAHRKAQLFVLDISFILFDLGILLVQLLLTGVLGSVLTALLGLALHLPVQTYREAAFAAFYLEICPKTNPAEETETKPSLYERWNHADEL